LQTRCSHATSRPLLCIPVILIDQPKTPWIQRGPCQKPSASLVRLESEGHDPKHSSYFFTSAYRVRGLPFWISASRPTRANYSLSISTFPYWPENTSSWQGKAGTNWNSIGEKHWSVLKTIKASWKWSPILVDTSFVCISESNIHSSSYLPPACIGGRRHRLHISASTFSILPFIYSPNPLHIQHSTAHPIFARPSPSTAFSHAFRLLAFLWGKPSNHPPFPSNERNRNETDRTKQYLPYWYFHFVSKVQTFHQSPINSLDSSQPLTKTSKKVLRAYLHRIASLFSHPYQQPLLPGPPW
jgi:hypothetical protein